LIWRVRLGGGIPHLHNQLKKLKTLGLPRVFFYIYKMDIAKILLATLFMTLGQIGSFMQLQGSIKYGWSEKYLWLLLLSGIPISYLYIKSVNLYVQGFGGQIWPSRLVGFALGVVIFTILSSVLFQEHLNLKTVISLILAFTIVGIQIFWK
jgi:hypothetical protein